MEQRITAHTQAIIINSPNNPSGVVYTEETLRGLAALLERKSAEYGHPIYIIADEPYRELVYGGVKVPFIPCLYKNTIVCYSYSKSLSLPGERIGYVYVPGFADDSARGVRRHFRRRPRHGPRLPAHTDAEGHRAVRRGAPRPGGLR